MKKIHIFHKWEYSDYRKFIDVYGFGKDKYMYSQRACVICHKIERTHDLEKWFCIKQSEVNNEKTNLC